MKGIKRQNKLRGKETRINRIRGQNKRDFWAEQKGLRGRIKGTRK